MKDLRSRKWLLTINNPNEHGYTRESLISLCKSLSGCPYFCISDEVGEKGTLHTHIFIYSPNAIRFSTLKNKFPYFHFDVCKGTALDNRNYVFKEDKWINSEKGSTNIKESHYEYGELPVERQGKRNDIEDLYDMIKSGMTNAQIIEESPQFLFQIDKIDRARATIAEDKYNSTWRDLYVEYIYGETGAGKTRSIMEKYGYENVYRITDYNHPFDGYKGQDIVIFEEFRSSLRIEDMLKYLDGYPCELPARYFNRTACFTKVYIISNIGLSEQYPNIQKEQIETWNALLRRIQFIRIFVNGTNSVIPTQQYLAGFIPCTEQSPFNK